MSFERIKEDHFKNIPFTKKQITDIYNSIYGTTKQEQNLVFVSTKAFPLVAGSPQNTIDLTPLGQLGYLHSSVNSHNCKFEYGFGFTPAVIVGASGTFEQINNVFFSKITQTTSVGFYFYTIFKFA
jgi:hypothetical protein